MKPNSTVLRYRTWIILAFLLVTLLLVPAAIQAQTLVQTMDLKQSNGSAALSSIAIDAGINTLYVADGATTNVYLIDTTIQHGNRNGVHRCRQSALASRPVSTSSVIWYWCSLMWHAHLAHVFTGGTPVPLFQTAPVLVIWVERQGREWRQLTDPHRGEKGTDALVPFILGQALLVVGLLVLLALRNCGYSLGSKIFHHIKYFKRILHVSKRR